MDEGEAWVDEGEAWVERAAAAKCKTHSHPSFWEFRERNIRTADYLSGLGVADVRHACQTFLVLSQTNRDKCLGSLL